MPSPTEVSPGAAGQEATFPPGMHHAYLFSMFNAFSFQIVLNSPMVLYAKTLGASATVLGIIAGMMPLLVTASRVAPGCPGLRPWFQAPSGASTSPGMPPCRTSPASSRS